MISNSGYSIIDQEIKPPILCSCGERIASMSIGLGRTPYNIHCTNCKSSLRKIMPSGIGWHLTSIHAIEAWNDYHEAKMWLLDKTFDPSEKMIREQMYRIAKGWGHNPR